MKNYGLLYPAAATSKKIATKFNLTPKKESSVSGVSFLSKTFLKTTSPLTSTLKREKKIGVRNLTKSIQKLRSHSYIENEPSIQINSIDLQQEDEQLFCQSSYKIGKIKQAFPYKNIDKELNEVLKVIREEKIKISEKMKVLKDSNQYYRKICEGNKSSKMQCAINTEQIIEEKRNIMCHNKSVSCLLEPIEEIKQNESTDSSDQADSLQKHEVYMRLAKMLEQMSINPNDILPHQDKLKEQITIEDYKTLTQKQTIKIQKFFIKKLIQKIAK